MDAFCFTGTFNQLTTKNTADLQVAFIENQGKLPSRREIRNLSEKISLSQSRIRKWFLEHASPGLPSPPPPGIPEESADVKSRISMVEESLQSLQGRLQILEEQMRKTKVELDTIAFFTQGWLYS
jgi:hypothetical protein